MSDEYASRALSATSMPTSPRFELFLFVPAPDWLDTIMAALGFWPALLSRQCDVHRWQAWLLMMMLALRLLGQRLRDPWMELRLRVEQMERPRCPRCRCWGACCSCCTNCWGWIRRWCRLRSAPPVGLHSASSASSAARVSLAEHLRSQSATTAAALASLKRDPRFRRRMAEIAADPVSTNGGNWQHGRFAHANLLDDPDFDEPPLTQAQRDRTQLVSHLKHTLREWIIVFLLGRFHSAFIDSAATTIRVPLVAGLVLLLFPLGPMLWRRCCTPPMLRSNAARFRAISAPMWRRIIAMMVDRAPILMHAALGRRGGMLAGQLPVIAALTLGAQALLCYPVHASFGARLLDLQLVRMPSGECDRRWFVLAAWLWMDVLRFGAAFVINDHALLFVSIVLMVAELGFVLAKRRSLMESCCSSKVIVGRNPVADEDSEAAAAVAADDDDDH